MNQEYGRDFFLALEKEKSTNMPFIPTRENIWRKQTRLPCTPKFLRVRLQSSGNTNTGGKISRGSTREKTLWEKRNRIPYMKFTWGVGEEKGRMGIAPSVT